MADVKLDPPLLRWRFGVGTVIYGPQPLLGRVRERQTVVIEVYVPLLYRPRGCGGWRLALPSELRRLTPEGEVK
jgi:hypothetical protein